MTASAWRHRVVAEAAELETEPPRMSLVDSQQWSNFVVFQPRWLPSETSLTVTTVRKEAPPGRVDGVDSGRTPWSTANPVAVRTEIGGDGRRLRLKQFLYDWAFPALDHPALWESPTRSQRLSGGDVMWLGTDYMGHSAASARLRRTMIEASVLEGRFEDAELRELYDGLAPVDPAAADVIAGEPFSRLSYWARRPETPTVAVPVGLWRFRRQADAPPARWSDSPTQASEWASSHGLPDRLMEYAVDSVGIFPGAAGTVEAVYTSHDRRRELRVITGERDAGHGLLGEAESHPASVRETRTIGGCQVRLAGIDTEVGPFDAVWCDGHRDVKLLGSTASGMDLDWFTAAVAALLE